MLSTKKLIAKLCKFVVGIQTPILATRSNVSVPATTWTEICKAILPAGGQYILLGYAGCGAATNGSNIAVGFELVSGTLSVNRLGSATGSTAGGGYKSIIGYVATTTRTEIRLREYLYGSGSTTAANGWIVAIPLKVGGVVRRTFNTLTSERRWAVC